MGFLFQNWCQALCLRLHLRFYVRVYGLTRILFQILGLDLDFSLRIFVFQVTVGQVSSLCRYQVSRFEVQVQGFLFRFMITVGFGCWVQVQVKGIKFLGLGLYLGLALGSQCLWFRFNFQVQKLGFKVLCLGLRYMCWASVKELDFEF